MSEQTEQAAQAHGERLMKLPNVMAVGGADDEVVVVVRRKVPLSELADEDVIDPTLPVVDPSVREVRTNVIESEPIEALLAPGTSIGLRGRGTGTYGGTVVDEHGRRYGLTNNHVAADSNNARVLTPVHSPGPADTLGPRFGTLGRFEPIYFDRPNRLDAALVTMEQGAKRSFQGRAPATARVGWRVSAQGRTSGRMEGVVTARSATVDVSFGDQGTARFVGQTLTTNMMRPGDSGSVAVSAGGHPVLLGFAGSPQLSVLTPILLVLRTLAVRFA